MIMKTILFYEYIEFDESKNIELIKHTLIKDKIVFKFREIYYECEHMTSGSYSNIIQDKDNPNKLKLYYRVCCNKRTDDNHQFTCLAISNNYGDTFNRPNLQICNLDNSKTNNIILKEYYSNHNFSVFYDKLNNTLLGIGGAHNSDKCNKDYKVIDHVWPNEEKYLLTPYVNNINRNNGLYLYTSKDGINWNILKNKPIYHGLYHSLSVKLGMVAFDTLPKILNNNKNYILYTRANTGLDIRSVVYSETTDFISWSSPQFITIKPPFDYNEDNIYFLGGFNYPNTNNFIAFPPFFKTKQPGRITYYACTKILYSYDGKNWVTLNNLFERKERYKYDIAGFINAPNGKDFYIFFHENVYKNNNNITRYIIRRDGFTSIYSKKGYFILKVQTHENYYINYKTENNGYIEIEFLDMNKNIIQDKIKLNGDEINKNIHYQQYDTEKQDNIYIKCDLYDSHIYSISY